MRKLFLVSICLVFFGFYHDGRAAGETSEDLQQLAWGVLVLSGGVPGGPEISDNFSSDNITDIINSVTVSGGYAANGTGYAHCAGYHNAGTLSDNDDQCVQAEAELYAGVVLRYDTTSQDGYIAYQSASDTIRVALITNNAEDETECFDFDGFTGITFSLTAYTSMRVQADSSHNFNVWAWNGSSWVASADNPQTFTTYQYTGAYVGVFFNDLEDAGDIKLDSLEADPSCANLSTP